MKLAFNETTQDYDLLEDADATDPEITQGYTDNGYKIVPVTDAQVAEIKAKPSHSGKMVAAGNIVLRQELSSLSLRLEKLEKASCILHIQKAFDFVDVGNIAIGVLLVLIFSKVKNRISKSSV